MKNFDAIRHFRSPAFLLAAALIPATSHATTPLPQASDETETHIIYQAADWRMVPQLFPNQDEQTVAEIVDDNLPAHSRKRRFAQRASDSVTPFLIGGLALSAAMGGTSAAERTTKSFVANSIATGALKYTIRARRPSGHSRTSFPSGHTSSAVAMAMALGNTHPNLQAPALGAAAVIGWSRVKVDAHYWHDVAAGAALGYAMSQRYNEKR